MTTETAPRKTGASVQFIANLFQISKIYWFGPSEIKDTFGVKAEPLPVPALFSEKVLDRAWRMGCCIVQQIAAAANGAPLTLNHLYKSLENGDYLNGKFLYSVDWYAAEPFFTTQTPRSGIFIKGRDIVAGSTGKTFVGESLVAADFAEKLFGDELPDEYGTAIEELRSGADALENLGSRNWKEGARQCMELTFSQLFRESPVEVLYRTLLAQRVNRERLFESRYTRTNVRSSDGDVVGVGDTLESGACLGRWRPQLARGHLGFSFSCSGERTAGG